MVSRDDDDGEGVREKYPEALLPSDDVIIITAGERKREEGLKEDAPDAEESVEEVLRDGSILRSVGNGTLVIPIPDNLNPVSPRIVRIIFCSTFLIQFYLHISSFFRFIGFRFIYNNKLWSSII